MSDAAFNPYAAPQARLVPQAIPTQIWRQGDLLVVQKSPNVTLPDRCVKCNAPAEGRRLRRKLYWHSPALFLLVLLNLIIYAVVALCVRKSADFQIGICERHLARRRTATMVGWLLALVGTTLIILATAELNNDTAPIGIIAGVLVLLVGVVCGLVGSRVVSAQRIDDYYAWVKGVCPEYLAELPDTYQLSAPLSAAPVAMPQIVAEPPASLTDP